MSKCWLAAIHKLSSTVNSFFVQHNLNHWNTKRCKYNHTYHSAVLLTDEVVQQFELGQYRVSNCLMLELYAVYTYIVAMSLESFDCFLAC